jgi:hypothetical protein
MDQNISEPFGNVPHDSESFGTVPKASEEFRKLPNVSESFGNTQSTVVKSENHSMTVREAARAFETSGVARTERSIINWCQPNRQGVSRLDCYFEENDHKYYITPASVERAIHEELAKAREQGVLPNPSERVKEEPEPKREEPVQRPEPETPAEGNLARLKELELENRDLQITTRAKDMFIEQLQKDREAFVHERQQLIDQLISSSRQIGELETKLLQIEAPKPQQPNLSERTVREAETEPAPREARSERTQTVPNTPPAANVTRPEPVVHEAQVQYPPSYQS